MNPVLLIILDGQSPHKVQDFFIDDSLAGRFQIVYWQIKPIFDDSRLPVLQQEELRQSIYQVFEQFTDLEKAISIIADKTKICFYFGWSRYDSLKIYAILNKVGISWVRFNTTSFYQKKIAIFLSMSKQLLKESIYKWRNNCKLTPDYVASVGLKSKLYHSKLGFIKHIPLMSEDYERFLRQTESTSFEQPYMLYIDQNLVEHRDFKNKPNLRLPSYDYYTALAEYFKEMEITQGLPVKIALHYTNESAEFREVFKDFDLYRLKTHELVKDAVIIFGHFSSAIGYGILGQKPIGFLSFGDAYPYGQRYLLRMARELQAPVIDITQPIKKTIDYQIHRNAYKKYIKNYLLEDELELTNKERILKFLSSK